jgi:hypothetical protein
MTIPPRARLKRCAPHGVLSAPYLVRVGVRVRARVRVGVRVRVRVV